MNDYSQEKKPNKVIIEEDELEYLIHIQDDLHITDL